MNKLYKLSKAFTLFELMVVLFVIGIVATITMETQKPFDRQMALLYGRAYTGLNEAVYNVNLNLASGNPFPTTSAALCTELIKVINTPESNCAATEIDVASNVFPAAPAAKFTTSNGMKVYISSLKTVTISAVQYKFFLVFFDINGSGKPNSVTWSQNKMSDIVAFLVTDKADVLPVGYPEIDKRYITAQVYYPDGSLPTEINRFSNAMSYYNAKWTAWGNTYNPNELMSVDFNSNIPTYLQVNPYPTVHEALNTAMTCVANTPTKLSPCEVELAEYQH